MIWRNPPSMTPLLQGMQASRRRLQAPCAAMTALFPATTVGSPTCRFLGMPPPCMFFPYLSGTDKFQEDDALLCRVQTDPSSLCR